MKLWWVVFCGVTMCDGWCVTVVWWWCGGAGILNHWFPDKTEKKIKGGKKLPRLACTGWNAKTKKEKCKIIGLIPNCCWSTGVEMFLIITHVCREYIQAIKSRVNWVDLLAKSACVPWQKTCFPSNSACRLTMFDSHSLAKMHWTKDKKEELCKRCPN